MEINTSELDLYDFTTCPFNENHRLQSPDQFKYHISRCKDRNFTHIKHQIVYCPFNICHVYISQAKLNYHVPRCTSHPLRETISSSTFGEKPKSLEYTACKYNSNHQILKADSEAYHIHIWSCPSANNPHKSPPPIVLDLTLTGIENNSHGLIPVLRSFN
ncbi:unnamed protein product [Blepharisma stoltei]|uniref:Gametocyte-specific factor 1 n=1 Tax=Blepharisma stoltei TaxID=1481888 RepID=A0AAU9IVU3_9CILI|nr:unnamed protein product [Blepharisma stoltei]